MSQMTSDLWPLTLTSQHLRPKIVFLFFKLLALCFRAGAVNSSTGFIIKWKKSDSGLNPQRWHFTVTLHRRRHLLWKCLLSQHSRWWCHQTTLILPVRPESAAERVWILNSAEVGGASCVFITILHRNEEPAALTVCKRNSEGLCSRRGV